MPTAELASTPDVDADGNIETPAGQAAEKKKNKNLTIAGVALGAIGVAIVIYLHAKGSASAASGGTANTVASPNTTGTVFPGGDAGYGSGGDVLANSSIFATQATTENNEFAAIQSALSTIATQNQAIGTYEIGIGQQNQSLGNTLANVQQQTSAIQSNAAGQNQVLGAIQKKVGA
jgi:flagellin-like hook-associated protein FlgL